MKEAEKISAKGFCNVLAMQKGLDPAGSAGDFEDAVIVEIPLPWKNDMYEKAGSLPQEVIDLLQLWLKRYHEGIPYNHRPLMVAPDPVYSRPGFRRVMYYSRPPGAFVRFEKVEYLVPESDYGALIWSLFEAKDDLARFELYREHAGEASRDILVCTHGTVDAACAKFGYPLYNLLRKQYADDQLRVWRVSHFGGHVFAPTLMDMPLGHYWAYVEPPQAEQIVAQRGPVGTLRGHYRGWAGLEYGFMQAAEREMWQREGWQWFDAPKQGTILAQDMASEEPQWMDVRIEFMALDGTTAAYEAHVELSQPVETEHSTSEAHTYPYPQYVVTRLGKYATSEKNRLR